MVNFNSVMILYKATPSLLLKPHLSPILFSSAACGRQYRQYAKAFVPNIGCIRRKHLANRLVREICVENDWSITLYIHMGSNFLSR